MICILHGFLLEGSGSNLWTRSISEALCRQGHDVHLMAQENHPDRYPFITALHQHHRDGGTTVTTFESNPYPGGCTLHKPDIGDTLPVYVWDRYEEFRHVVPMIELDDETLAEYVSWNAQVLLRIVEMHNIQAVHANHSVLMPQVAERVAAASGIPFTVMPHGSGLEFAVKRDLRFQRMAEHSFRRAATIFVHGEEMRARVLDALPGAPDIEGKFVDLHLGVDTSRFRPIPASGRHANIERLLSAAASLPRGRAPESTAHMLDGLHSDISLDELTDVLERGRGHDHKTPDADLEQKLTSLDWQGGSTLLYVGRLISTKGVQGVIAALPRLLEARPDLRVILVGHGPLREVLEAMVWAMERGDIDLIQRVAEHGRTLEKAPEGDTGGTALTQVTLYLEKLRAAGQLDRYISAARNVRAENVIFTGYLTHSELHLLFPCCDAAIFPSVVKEAGPLVFLEALASGAFPLGTYFGGMRESIDTIADALPDDVVEVMKLSADPAHTVADIVRNVPPALDLGRRHQAALFDVARDRYDWTSVARTFYDRIEGLTH
ncbi:MAG TPA: glycosyltransferase [Longimicrobiales bacterium]